MPYKDADRVNRKLKLLEQQKHGMVKETTPFTSVVTRGSANRDQKRSVGASVVTAPKTTAPKASSTAKSTGTILNYASQSAVSKAVSDVPYVAPVAKTVKPAPDYSAPAAANSGGGKQQNDGFQRYMQMLGMLETARAQEVEAQNAYLKTKDLVKKGKEILQNGGDLAAAQADVRRIAARNTASVMGEAAKKAGNNGAALLDAQTAQKRAAANTAMQYGQNAWNHHANSADVYSRALAEQGKTTAQMVKNRANHYGDAASVYSTAMKQQAEQTSNAARDVGQFVDRYVVDAHRDFGNNPDLYKIKAQTLGVTGSDQTVASFYGYQNDTRAKQPQNHWDVETKKEYRMQKSGGKQNAEQFAIGVNTDYHNRRNEEARQRQIEKIRKEINDDYYASLHAMGARAASQVRAVDGYNSLLEYAATGKMSTQPRLSAGEYADLVDDRISERLEQKHGKLASGTYRIGTKAFDSIASYGALGPEIDLFKSAGESSADALVKAKNNRATDEQAANYAFWKGMGEAAVDFTGEVSMDLREHTFSQLKKKIENKSNFSGVAEQMNNIEKAYESIPEQTRDAINNTFITAKGAFIKKATDEFLKESSLEQSEFNTIVEKYKGKGFSDKHAKHIASYEMMKKYGSHVLDEITLDAAQRKFAKSLERNFDLKR